MHIKGMSSVLWHCFSICCAACYEARLYARCTPYSVHAALTRMRHTTTAGAPTDLLALVTFSFATPIMVTADANLLSNVNGLREVLPEDLVSCHDRSLSFLPWAHCECSVLNCLLC